MSITATELKENLSKYLMLSITQDIFITKNGKVISKLTNPFQNRVDIAKSLIGVIPDSLSLEESKRERIENL
ncbi:MAG: type II toxin-antitoxin system prevent-host-death family antitoxin [Clostridia bacterium]|nr:type II toxin-antitoxin system prevent-host-death family antitoxin [Clostridia bacterium]